MLSTQCNSCTFSQTLQLIDMMTAKRLQQVRNQNISLTSDTALSFSGKLISGMYKEDQ